MIKDDWVTIGGAVVAVALGVLSVMAHRWGAAAGLIVTGVALVLVTFAKVKDRIQKRKIH